MSKIERPYKHLQLKMIMVYEQQEKLVPCPSDKTYLELLDYCNELNVSCLTYGTVYVVEKVYD